MHGTWVTLSLQLPPVWWSRPKVKPPDTTKSFSLRNLFEGCITMTAKEHSGWMLCLREKSQIIPTTFHAWGKSLWILNETTSKIRSKAETLWREAWESLRALPEALGKPESAALDFTRKVHSSDAGKRPCHSTPWRNDCWRDMARWALGEAAAAIASSQTRGSSPYCWVPQDAWHCSCLRCVHFEAREQCQEDNSPVEINVCLSEANLFAFLQHIHG